MNTSKIEIETVRDFLAGYRIVVVGASDDQKNFGRTIVRALRDHGYDVVAVNPTRRALTVVPVLATSRASPGRSTRRW